MANVEDKENLRIIQKRLKQISEILDSAQNGPPAVAYVEGAAIPSPRKTEGEFAMNAKATNQTIRMLPVGELLVGGYQCPTNTAQVDKIAASLTGPLRVRSASACGNLSAPKATRSRMASGAE